MSRSVAIGLEVHAQLLTETKLFCGCATRMGTSPNRQVCATCLGLPGALPVVNQMAVALGIRAALALGATVHPWSRWARKSYFYPDLPKGYQISQFDHPLATRGRLRFLSGGRAREVLISRLHLEEDAGKAIHDPKSAPGQSLIDFNRAGVPLLEIVSAPEIHSGREAADFLKELRRVLRHLGISNGNMEAGSLRVDVNVSLPGGTGFGLGVRTEIKNLNSFRFVAQAIDVERARHTDRLQRGLPIVPETRHWDEKHKSTVAGRAKEAASDYQFFPEPDLPDLIVEPTWRAQVAAERPELPLARQERYQLQFGLSVAQASLLTEAPGVGEYFEAAVANYPRPVAIANWLLNVALPTSDSVAAGGTFPEPAAVAALVALIDDGVVSSSMARRVWLEMAETGVAPAEIIGRHGWHQITAAETLRPIVERVIQSNPRAVEALQRGKLSAQQHLTGMVMKETRGRADPLRVKAILAEILGVDL